MRKIIFMILLVLVIFVNKAAACSPTFPSLWPPQISSTESTEHSAGITWSMGLPFVGDITAYRIYLNGALVHTISPNITSLMFSPAGHGSYSVNNLTPSTDYTMSVGVVFAIPVGCGITWNVEMKSSASIETKPADWNHGVSSGNMYTATQDASVPGAPDITASVLNKNEIQVNYDVSSVYNTPNFEQEKYPITQLYLTVGSACNIASYAGYQNSPYYTSGQGYNLNSPQECNAIEQYKTEYIRVDRVYNSKPVCRYVLNHPLGIINKTISLNGSTTGQAVISGLTGDGKYVVYGYVKNSNGDISNISAPILITTPQGKTITPANCGRNIGN